MVVTLNLILRGWKAYFRNGTSARKFTIIDNYVNERLAIFDNAKHGRTKRNWQPRQQGVAGANWCVSSQQSDGNGECACLTMNDVGKPCAGEPHARFDRGCWQSGDHGASDPMHLAGNGQD